VGLAAYLTSQFYAPSEVYMIDIDPNRLRVAADFGAKAVDNREGKAVEQILDLTKGQGVDVVIEAIGSPAGWYVSEKIVKAGGNIAILGVHGKSVTLHLEEMWKRNFTMTAGLVHTTTIPLLLRMVQCGKLNPRKLISHYFELGELERAYDTFSNAAEHCALKVLMTNES
jgi:alcohol dehydrogenase